MILKLLFAGLCITLLSYTTVKKYSKTQNELDTCKKIVTCNYPKQVKRITKFNCPCELTEFLKRIKVRDPYFWTKVAIAESGCNFSSPLATQGNNIFGFTYVADTNRNIGNLYGWSKYKDQQQSAEDVKNLITFWRSRSSFYDLVDEPTAFSKSGYCASPETYLPYLQTIDLACKRKHN